MDDIVPFKRVKEWYCPPHSTSIKSYFFNLDLYTEASVPLGRPITKNPAYKLGTKTLSLDAGNGGILAKLSK